MGTGIATLFQPVSLYLSVARGRPHLVSGQHFARARFLQSAACIRMPGLFVYKLLAELSALLLSLELGVKSCARDGVRLLVAFQERFSTWLGL